MSFMQSYKRLDVLCRDMNGIGISGYIADMEQLTNGRLFVDGWEKDYRLLKHYRHIRNRIAHDVDATEDALCTQRMPHGSKSFMDISLIKPILWQSIAKLPCSKRVYAVPRRVFPRAYPALPLLFPAQTAN